MEKRLAKVNISAAGGTAGKDAKTYKLTIPSSWVMGLGVKENEREVQISFDENRIIIEKKPTLEQFEKKCMDKGHKVYELKFWNGDELCSRICADFTGKQICAENYTQNLVRTAFGRKTLPSWEDFLEFLEERCIPRTRGGLREYLEVLGLSEYDPFEIIQITKGKMAEDQQWIEVVSR